MLARRRVRRLLLEHHRREIPADGDDVRGPGDAVRAPERPAARQIAAMRREHVDDMPIGFIRCPAVYAKARAAAAHPDDAGRPFIEHDASRAIGSAWLSAAWASTPCRAARSGPAVAASAASWPAERTARSPGRQRSADWFVIRAGLETEHRSRVCETVRRSDAGIGPS